MRIITPLVLGVLLFGSGCSLSSKPATLVLEPQLAPAQVVREGHAQSVTVSRKFHTVEVSPHPVLAPDQNGDFISK